MPIPRQNQSGAQRRACLMQLAAMVRASSLAERNSAFTDRAAARIEMLAAIFGAGATIEAENLAKAELAATEEEIAQATAEAFSEGTVARVEAANARGLSRR